MALGYGGRGTGPEERERATVSDSPTKGKAVKHLSEDQLCKQVITPALEKAGWSAKQIKEQYHFTVGKVVVRGSLVSRGKRKFVDYLLSYNAHTPLAIVEAKDNNHSIDHGMQQGLEYARHLDVPFVFSTNGDGFVLHDRSGTYDKVEQNLTLEEFPSPEDLYERYKIWRGLDDVDDALLGRSNFTKAGDKQPRYYQQLAINRTVEAILSGQDRALLVMATGTGKTYTAFQIIWKLWKARVAKRTLFLADRNILVDQAMVNDFRPFGTSMVKLDRSLVDSSGRVNTAYEIYLSLYQAIIGGGKDNIYDKFPRDFFDLIVVDECHRGSAKEDSLWREILDYFSSAVQVGLTATPKETKYVSNINYFGEPTYTYSLKQGIEDGFLAPFKVVRVDLDVDVLGWRPEAGQTDDNGEEIEDRIYNVLDVDRNIIFPKRHEVVAQKVSEFLQATDPMHKTIVFCEDIKHAEAMRKALVNVPENRPNVEKDHRYVMRITGDEREGKEQLDNFIDPKREFPVIATTSKLLTTGVDAQTCHLIVLDQTINSMTEFKQIIGRGTRLRTDFDKYFFTIMDFRKATELFADPDWDGPPISIYEPGADDPITPPSEIDDDTEPSSIEDAEPGRRITYRVGDQDVTVVAERVQYLDSDGKLVTESLKDYTRTKLQDHYESLDHFLKVWSEADQKSKIIEELADHGIILEALEDEVGKDLDTFDMICHLAFDRPPLTRRERVENVRKRDVFAAYGEYARAVLDALLEKYADQGVTHIEDIRVLQVYPFDEFGTMIEIVKKFGGKDQYLQAVRTLEVELYGLGDNPGATA